MNSIIQAAMNGAGLQRDGQALAQLRDRLTSLGVKAELLPDNSALIVRRPEPGLPVWVFVGYGGAYFSWQSAERRHPVGDVEGAANVLAECVAK
jgi:hypothetical protein